MMRARSQARGVVLTIREWNHCHQWDGRVSGVPGDLHRHHLTRHAMMMTTVCQGTKSFSTACHADHLTTRLLHGNTAEGHLTRVID